MVLFRNRKKQPKKTCIKTNFLLNKDSGKWSSAFLAFLSRHCGFAVCQLNMSHGMLYLWVQGKYRNCDLPVISNNIKYNKICHSEVMWSGGPGGRHMNQLMSFGSYQIVEQGRHRLAAQTDQSLRCSHTQSFEVDEDWPNSALLSRWISSWVCMRIWDKYQNLICWPICILLKTLSLLVATFVVCL